MLKALIIADDLTGAMDTAVHFAAAGFNTGICVLIRSTEMRQVLRSEKFEVLAINAGTRHLPSWEAGSIVYSLVRMAAMIKIPYIYKKTDSAMRGNVGAELSAMRDALKLDRLPFVPAYPRLGRTVRGGVLYINGVPAAETALGKDPFTPLSSSRVSEILAQTCEPEDAEKIEIFDAETDEQLEQLGGMPGERIRFCAGCGGFAEILSRLLSAESRPAALDPAPAMNGPEQLSPVLIINGSLHPNSLAQVREAAENGAPAFPVPVTQTLASHLQGSLVQRSMAQSPMLQSSMLQSPLVSGAIAALKEKGICILSTSGITCPAVEQEETAGHSITAPRTSAELPPSSPAPTAKQLAEKITGSLARMLCDTGEVKTLCVFGGDTLLSVVQALGVPEMRVRCELQPGVVLGSLEFNGKTLNLISKAGSFGKKDLILQLFPS